MTFAQQLGGSFRDPAGFIFRQGTTLYRQVNKSYSDQYEYLIASGLYNRLTSDNLLVPHEEIQDFAPRSLVDESYKILKPALVPFVSYPYEWSFGQLKSAALLLLKIQTIALSHGMTLKDASAYNVQFIGTRPVLIDTLSFERYTEGSPWVAYQQFCQHFLAPLILMAYLDLRLNSLSSVFVNGIPLDLVYKLLPLRAWFNIHHFLHLFLQLKLQNKFASTKQDKDPVASATLAQKVLNLNVVQNQAIVEDLQETVAGLKIRKQHTTWEDYYQTYNYSEEASTSKQNIVLGYLTKITPQKVWDFGSNNGLYSRLIADKASYVVSVDADPLAVDHNFQNCLSREQQNILPLLIDITNPTPAIGWANRERYSLLERGPLDCSLALGLVHHLVLSNDLPFAQIAEYFARCAQALIVEFIPKSDEQVNRLLNTVAKSGTKHEYDQLQFENGFANFFHQVQSEQIADSERRLYLMAKR